MALAMGWVGCVAGFVAGVVGVCGVAAGQPPPLEPGPPEHPFLRYGESRDWMVVSNLTIQSCLNARPLNLGPGGSPFVETDVIRLDGARLWFPIGGAWTGGVMLSERFGARYLRGGTELRGVDRVAVSFGPASLRYAEVDLGALSFSGARFEFETAHRSWAVEIDEAKAGAVAWPAGPVTGELALWLGPQYGVPVGPLAGGGQNPARAAIVEWTENDPDPKGMLGPYRFVKFLAARMIENMAINAAGAQPRQTPGAFGSFASGSGINRLGPEAAWEALSARSGSEVELVCAFVAMCRELGLPSRLVIGTRYGPLAVPRFGRRFDDELTAWAEVYLWGEGGGGGEAVGDGGDGGDGGGWVPVDVIRQRELRAKAPGLDEPWAFVGSHPEFMNHVALAYTLHPPAPSSWFFLPALWGWQTDPAGTLCGSQFIEIDMTGVSREAGSPEPRFQRSTTGR